MPLSRGKPSRDVKSTLSAFNFSARTFSILLAYVLSVERTRIPQIRRRNSFHTRSLLHNAFFFFLLHLEHHYKNYVVGEKFAVYVADMLEIIALVVHLTMSHQRQSVEKRFNWNLVSSRYES